MDYDYPWVDLIARFKFHGDVGLAQALAGLMRNAPWAQRVLDSARWVLPIPLSEARLRERGYNQAALLAQSLSPHRCRTDLLRKTLDTPLQHTLNRQNRLRVMRQALMVPPDLRSHLVGQTVLVVDDVMTTGASLRAAAHALKKAGAARVDAFVLARTPEPQPELRPPPASPDRSG
ncbi:MAG: hypothetical protein OHK0048_08450 [Rhodoferax sp.]